MSPRESVGRHRWWARESTRQMVALPLVVAVFVAPGDHIVKVLVAWDVYALCYLVMTWLAYRGHDAASLREITLEAQRPGLAHRLQLASSPNQVSQTAAMIAMITTVIALPQARNLDAPLALVLPICVVAVVTSWLMLQAGFLLEYLNVYMREGGLRFPGGDQEPVVADVLYFAVGVGTTFATSDVDVTSTRIRKLITVHGLLAFVFNTLVLAATVTLLVSYIGT